MPLDSNAASSPLTPSRRGGLGLISVCVATLAVAGMLRGHQMPIPAPPPLASAPSAHPSLLLCDRLAGNPLDPQIAEGGVAMTALRADPALRRQARTACEAARAAAPAAPRPATNLARVLLAAGEARAALDLLEVAPAVGYPIARFLIADTLREQGHSGPARAALLVLASADQPLPPALLTLAAMQACGLGGPADLGEAAASAARALQAGRLYPDIKDFGAYAVRIAAEIDAVEAGKSPAFCPAYAGAPTP